MSAPHSRVPFRMELLATGLLMAAAAPASLFAASGTWVGPAGTPAATYNWTTATQWNVTPLYPDGNTQVARFDMNNAGTPSTQMIVDAPIRLGVLDYNESGNTNFTLGNGSNSITFNNGGSTAFLYATKQATLEGSPDASGTSLLRFHVNVNLVLEDNLSVQLKSSRNSDWTNVISGAGRLTLDTTGSSGYGTGDDVGLGGASANIHGGGTKLIGNGVTATALEFTTDKVNALGSGLLELQTARLQLNQDQTVSGLSGPSGAILNNGAATRTLTLNFASGAGPHTYSGTLENTGAQAVALILNGSGTQVLSQSGNSYTGATTIQSGLLVAAGGGAIGDASAVSLNNSPSASLRLDAHETIGSLAGGGASGGNVNLQSFTLTAGANGGSTSYSGLLSGSGGLTKTGAGNLTLGNDANTYTGRTRILGGSLEIANGSESTLGAPVAAADALELNGGTLRVNGSLTVNDPGRGVALGASGGTIRVDGGTFLLSNTLSGSAGNLTKAGTGAFQLAADGTFNAVVVAEGTHRQSSGLTQIQTVSTGLEIQNLAAFELTGGTLRVDRINQVGSGSFLWGAGRLGHYNYSGVAFGAGADLSSTGYQTVKVGKSLAVTGSLTTGDNAILALHGSPTFFLGSGVLFNNVTVSGNLSLTGEDDVLEVEINPYLLRPVSFGGGSAATEAGSLPLVTWGGTRTGIFDTFSGIVDDGRGFGASTFAVSGPTGAAGLDVNTYYLEYDDTNRTLWFHYKVAGYVPEPGSFALMTAGAWLLRILRRRWT